VTAPLPPPDAKLTKADGGPNTPWFTFFSSLRSTADAATSGLGGLGTAAAEDIGTSGESVPMLDAVNAWSGQQHFALATLTEADALAGWDLNTKQTAVLTMTSSFELANALNAKPGATYQLAVHAGAFVLTFGTMYKFPAGGAVITTVGDCLFSFFCPSAGVLWCVGVKEFA
jgi:hypothetical protein